MHPSLMTREWGKIPTTATWRQTYHTSGAVEWKLDYPLYRGEHRSRIWKAANGTVLANGPSGYVRQFDTVEAAQADIAKHNAEVKVNSGNE